MSRNQWSRRRAANQPSKTKTARYNHDNERSAQLILDNPDRHPVFMVAWVERFQQRRAEESRESPVSTTLANQPKQLLLGTNQRDTS